MRSTPSCSILGFLAILVAIWTSRVFWATEAQPIGLGSPDRKRRGRRGAQLYHVSLGPGGGSLPEREHNAAGDNPFSSPGRTSEPAAIRLGPGEKITGFSDAPSSPQAGQLASWKITPTV